MQIDFEKYEVDEKERSITFSCASNVPYTRYDEQQKTQYDQILVIDEKAVDLTRLNNGAPLLYQHDMKNLLGIVDKAWIVEDRIFVKVRFSKNDPLADRVYKDILDSTIKNVSIGYQINHYKDVQQNGRLKRYVDNYCIYECSIVSAPADTSVGIRKLTLNKEIKNMDEQKVKEQAVAVAEQPKKEQQVVNEQLAKLQAENEELKKKLAELEADKEQAVEQPKNEAEQQVKEQQVEQPIKEQAVDDKDKQQIEAIAKDFKVPQQEVKSAIENKLSVREFKDKVKNINFKNKEVKNMDNSLRDFTAYLQARNFESPFNLRDYTGWGTGAGQGGANLVHNQQLPLVEALKKKIALKGYRTISGIKGTISIPVQSTRPSVAFKAFHADADQTKAQFNKVNLTPHLLIGECRIGRDLLFEATDDVSAFIINQFTDEIAYKIQDYMLGKVLTGAANTVTYTALTAVDRQDILEMEAKLNGFAMGIPTFVVSPNTRAVLKNVKIDSGSGKFLCENSEMNGYDVGVSGCITTANDHIYFGDWAKLVLATWDKGLNVQVDPYSYSSSQQVKIVASIGVDAAVIDGNAFVIGKVQSSSESSESSASI